MTIGDFVMYLFFTGMMAAPVVQMASIGTQITEAFAGLDRIREVKQTLAEDAEDGGKASLDTLRGEVDLRPGVVRVQPRRAGAEGHHVHRAGRIDDGAGRLERIRQEHAGQPGDGLQPAGQGRHPHRRPRPRRPQAGQLPLAPRHRAAGQLPVRRHHHREHPLRQAARVDGRGEGSGPRSPTATSSSRSSPTSTTRSSASAASACRAASASAWRSPAPSSPIRAS